MITGEKEKLVIGESRIVLIFYIIRCIIDILYIKYMCIHFMEKKLY